MCGATQQQTQLEQEELSAYQDAQKMTAEEYANQEAIYGPMSKQFQSIFDLGPNQTGFSAAESNTLNAQAVAGTAENYSQAAKAVGEGLAAEGGGSEELPTGGQAQLKAEVASSAANAESQEETGIQEANYQQGRQNWQNAGEGLMSIASGENPLGYENAATGAGSAAASEANQIASENNSWINAALGVAGELGSSVIDQNPGGIFGG